jgi:hypothetical protein
MDESVKNALLALREEGMTKAKQAEADLYYFQGYVKAIEDVLNGGLAISLDDLKAMTGARSMEVVKNES